MTPKDRLLNKEIDLNKNYQELDNLSPLLFAAKHGVAEFIESTLSGLPQDKIKGLISATNAEGFSALHFACRYGQVKAVKCLLNFGAQASVVSSLGYLPIHMIFSDKNDRETTEQLFELFMNDPVGLQARTSSNESIAHLAASKGYTNILKYLQSHAPKLLNSKDNQSMTPLLTAVLNNQIETVKYLLDNSDASLTNSKGQNALQIAAQFSTTEMFVSLLPYFDKNLIDNEKNTALDFAKQNEDEEKISALVNFGSTS